MASAELLTECETRIAALELLVGRHALEIGRGLVGSMSRRGNPYDNSEAESFMKVRNARNPAKIAA